MADEKFDAVGTNIAEKATMIWNVADMLRGQFNYRCFYEKNIKR